MWKFIGFLILIFTCASGAYAGDRDIGLRSKALAHYMMAVAYDLDDRTDKAVKEYERSIAFNPREPLPHLRLATYYVRDGLLEKSLGQLKQVIEADPGNFQAHYLLALVYSSQKKYVLAASEYESILKGASKDDPDNLEVYIYLAQLYFTQEKYAQAIEQFHRILAVQPTNAAAMYFLGASYLQMHERAKAKECFEKTLGLEPDHDGALNSVAYMDAEDDMNLDDALVMARRAVALDSSNGAYYDTLGWVLHKKGLNSQALLALQKAEVYIQDPIVYEHMGDVYQCMGEFALAHKSWDKSLRLDPHQPQVQVKINKLEKLQAFCHHS